VESTTYRKALWNQAVARCTYGARSALRVKECGYFRRNRPKTAYKYQRARAGFMRTQTGARCEAAFRAEPDGPDQPIRDRIPT
jgi:hypothetical protein